MHRYFKLMLILQGDGGSLLPSALARVGANNGVWCSEYYCAKLNVPLVWVLVGICCFVLVLFSLVCVHPFLGPEKERYSWRVWKIPKYLESG